MYFAVESLAVSDGNEKIKTLVEYDIQAEVKWCNGSPCLIEVGSRCHGGEGTFRYIVDQTIGYDQDDTESR